jgi:hypothetical protein
VLQVCSEVVGGGFHLGSVPGVFHDWLVGFAKCLSFVVWPLGFEMLIY